MLLEALKFVRGSVAKKDLVPELTHFRIENGTVRGYNGVIGLCSPVMLDIACNPKAEPLIKAISNCTETVSMSMTPTGRLSIKSGKFKALIDCVEGETPHATPEGEHVVIDGVELLKACKTLSAFIGDDASRDWSNGILLQDSSAFATNNVIAVEYWIGTVFPHPVNLPLLAVKEILRIDEAPIGAQLASNSLTLHYEGGRWLRTQLSSTDWPNITGLLDANMSEVVPLDQDFFTGLEAIKPFVDKVGRVFFMQGAITTDTAPEIGATYELSDFNYDGIYNISMLLKLAGKVTHIDFSRFPKPCPFTGERMRGVILGLKL